MQVLEITLLDFYEKFEKVGHLWLYDGLEVYSISRSLLEPSESTHSGESYSSLESSYGSNHYITYSSSIVNDIPYTNPYNWACATPINVDISSIIGTVTLKDYFVSMGSDECLFSYGISYKRELQLDNEYYVNVYISVYHNGTFISSVKYNYYTDYPPLLRDVNLNSVASDHLQTYIDDCVANLKIKTTCCLLVCCEPDKYELI